ncbi:Uncharacterised protein [Chromobacterium violaceum]|uniref:Uncharacterized protein n=1 Tax=Chromobacterium violaceum TaxID=536 RepID=A0A3S5DLS4_CHRVL|nr:Uncharacterised protein [Chromobacterium violaceum]
MEKTHISRLETAREVLLTEAAALSTLAERLNGEFLDAVEAILACRAA